MKTYTYNVRDEDIADFFMDEYNEILAAPSLLIQLFSGEGMKKMQNIVTILKSKFPSAHLIASSTDGEIYKSEVTTENSIVSISLFEHTELQTAHSDDADSFSMGVQLAQELVTEKTKLLITFADGLLCNGEEFLNGIYSIAPDITIAGGLSADNGEFKRTYLGVGEKLFKSGAVGVALNSDILGVRGLYSFGWNAIGVEHTITGSIKNRVYTIDGMTAVDFYTKYLGKNISHLLPKTGVEFPLILHKDGLEVARAVLAKHDDGSLSFAGNIGEGESVYLGVGEADAILSQREISREFAVETFFIYSCMARRRFMPDLVHKEIEPFAKVAPTSGFFTYGEFYTQKRPELLNQTLTAVALSEDISDLSGLKHIKLRGSEDCNSATYSALMHIINATSKELQAQTRAQENRANELLAKNKTLNLTQEIAHLGSWSLDLKSKKMEWSKESFEIYKVDPAQGAPTYREFLQMVVREDRQKLINIHRSLYDNKVKSMEVRVRRADGKIINVVESGKLVFENNEAVKAVGTTLDITELRLKDTLLMQQTKLAHMGEMINMIAHQWRQPLNAISSAAIKLSMQSEMDLATKETISATTEFIEEMTQNMSQTINDFMNFSKPSNIKESVNLKVVVDEVLKVIGTQLENHNIHLSYSVESEVPVVTYKKELEHVVMNIIANARDALSDKRGDDKEILIHISSNKKEHIIEISDNAGGIKEENLTRIFEPYFTTKSATKGTGLGLYMSKKIVNEHLGGSLRVRNRDDGALFSIILGVSDE